MRILITGGAGFIGSNCVRVLQKEGHEVVVFDNLVYGHRESIPAGVEFVEGDLKDNHLLDLVFKKYNIDVVMHFAAYAYVGESVENPRKYFENNYVNALRLFNAMVENKVNKIIFSSSCAVFGKPEKIPLSEDSEKKPINPYGLTKKMVEDTLEWYDCSYGLKSVCLRYFNAAGADFGIGEDHSPETHLIPLVFDVALGKRENIKIFGTDYHTKDGTCIRDYVHVTDLSVAHVLALNYLVENKKSKRYNLGSGEGYSVKEIIDNVREVTGKDIACVDCPRRAGDPDVLIADSSKIKNELGWDPQYGIRDIIQSAWEWHRNNPEGFKKKSFSSSC